MIQVREFDTQQRHPLPTRQTTISVGLPVASDLPNPQYVERRARGWSSVCAHFTGELTSYSYVIRMRNICGNQDQLAIAFPLLAPRKQFALFVSAAPTLYVPVNVLRVKVLNLYTSVYFEVSRVCI
eukprot:1194709-Prorocentrum_minimum.AAC.3